MILIDRIPAAMLRWAATARTVLWMACNQPPGAFLALLRAHWRAWRAAARMRAAYNLIEDEELCRRKRSERVFVFGSGYSINEISDAEWEKIGACDSIAFSGSFHLKKIPITYCLLRGWNETPTGVFTWREDAEEVLGIIGSNPFLDDCVFFLQKGFTAVFCNHLLGFGLWDKQRPTRLFNSEKVARYPRPGRAEIVHRVGTLCSAVSLAVSLGYTDIVLAGVDLYDNRYFWLPPDKTLGWSESEKRLVASDTSVRGAAVASPHNTVHNGIIEIMGDWHCHLEIHHGIKLSVYNPKSFLASTLPVYSWG